ncbi:MAG: exodeoxyribonuclease VII small subunit [Saprospiraceae bacterium]|nr:exodeoxyribonuclease VII small subunit [Saprospiraceae bacterium]MCB9322337.1 exodeoxyribonuclease VII small subunit [Lewinellaceae bacterium]
MEQMTYQQAFTELQSIIEALKEEIIDIDELTERSRRAAYLIQFCSEKLRSTEEEIKALFDDTEFN